MRYLITGGAGFIGSHLAEDLLASGHRSPRPRRPLHRCDRQHPPPQGAPQLLLHDRVSRFARHHRRARRRSRHRLPPRGRGRRGAHRREPRSHDRDQRPLHRDRSRAGQQEEEARLHRLHERGLRQERRPALPGGRRSPAWPDYDKGRWSYACSKAIDEYLAPRLLEGARAAGRDRTPVQHRRAAPDRPLRDGRSVLRAAGARRRARSPSTETVSSAAASATSRTSFARWPT